MLVVLIGALLAALAGSALAQLDPAQLKQNGFVEFGGTHHSLSSGLGTWNGEFVRGLVVAGDNTWHGDLYNWSQFGDQGTLVALGNTHVWNQDWYTYVSAATSSGGFFLPRLRLDAFVNRKVLSDRSLVLTVGAGFVDAKDVHQDTSLYLGATYYATPDWIVDGGVRFNNSNPGSVHSSYQHAAVTYGRNKVQYLTARYAFGREAYQIIGPSTVISDFNSHDTSVSWRKWIKSNWGVNLRGDSYQNPTYSRWGVDAAVFVDF